MRARIVQDIGFYEHTKWFFAYTRSDHQYYDGIILGLVTPRDKIDSGTLQVVPSRSTTRPPPPSLTDLPYDTYDDYY